MTDVFLGIDIGGSHVGVGLISGTDGNLLCSLSSRIHEHSTFESLVNFICTTVLVMIDEDIRSYHRNICIKGIGIGCPGQCKDGILVGACIFSFRNVPLADAVSAELSSIFKTQANIPTVLVNDADAAIAAEIWGIEGKALFASARNIAMITIGTGLGLGLVLDRRLYQGSRGLIEGGHMIIDNPSYGRKCSCGQIGCVEAYSSARNTSIRMFESDVEEERKNARLMANFLLDPDKVADNITDDLVTKPNYTEIKIGNASDVFARAANGEETAQKILNETVDALSVLCINLCRILDPDFIIIGGGMSHAGDTLLSLLKSNFKSRSWTILDDEVQIVLANNAEHSGIIGAAMLASSSHHAAQNIVRKDNRIENGIVILPQQLKAKYEEGPNYLCSSSASGGDCSVSHMVDDLNKDRRITGHSSEEKHTTDHGSPIPNNMEKNKNKVDMTVRLLCFTGSLSLLSASIAAYLSLGRKEECLESDMIQKRTSSIFLQHLLVVGQLCVASYSLYLIQKA